MLSRLQILFVRFFNGIDIIHKGILACLKLILVGFLFCFLSRYLWKQANFWRTTESFLPLRLNLVGPLGSEQIGRDGICGFQLVQLIRTAAKDPNVPGLILELDQLTESSLSALSYVGKALQEFRCTGKPIYAVGEHYTQTQYYLATFANKIYLDPTGGVEFRGFAMHRLYLGKLAEKLKVKPHVFSTGKHKSGYDIYTRSEPLSSEVDQMRSCLSEFWRQFVLTISNNRNLDADVVVATPELLLEKLKASDGNEAAYAAHVHLVDEILPSREARKALKKAFHQVHADDEVYSISYDSYMDKQYGLQKRRMNRVKRSTETSKIGVFTLTGVIENRNPAYQQNRIASLLQAAADDPQIAALVIRINSPGGDARLSEKIRSMLAEFKRCGKPLVISFGSIGASGGYWMAMTGDHLVAESTSLIGSIGVLSMVNDYSALLADLGINAHSIEVGGTQGYPPFSINGDALALMEFRVNAICKQFIHLVAGARRLPVGVVSRLADGSVWTGSMAEEKGLVDTVGDLEKAVEIAAELADCKQFEMSWIEEEREGAGSTWSARIRKAWRAQYDRFRRHLIQQVLEVWSETTLSSLYHSEAHPSKSSWLDLRLLARLPHLSA